MRPFAWRLPQLPAYRSGMMPPGMAAACASWKVSPATVYRHRQEPARPKLLANAHEPPPLLHPNMAEVWRQRDRRLARGPAGRSIEGRGFRGAAVAHRPGDARSRRRPARDRAARRPRGYAGVQCEQKEIGPRNGATWKRNYRWLRGRATNLTCYSRPRLSGGRGLRFTDGNPIGFSRPARARSRRFAYFGPCIVLP